MCTLIRLNFTKQTMHYCQTQREPNSMAGRLNGSKYHVWPTKVIQKLGRRNKPNSMAEHHPNLWNFAVNRRKHTENSQSHYLFMLVKILQKSLSFRGHSLLQSSLVCCCFCQLSSQYPCSSPSWQHDWTIQGLPSENLEFLLTSYMFLWVFLGEINLALPKNNDLPWFTPSCLSISVEENEAFRKIINFWGAIHSKPPLGSPAL